MPGIVGIIANRSDEDHSRMLNTMIEPVRREPFHTTGTCFEKRLGTALGWVSDKSSHAGAMPVWNERNDVFLVFVGENFAKPAIKAGLAIRGHEPTADDATQLLHLYEEQGIKFLNRINGWFSGVLVDLRQSRVILFNDRYGLRRIYYHESDDTFYFSSEAKSLLKILPRLRSLDPRGLGELISLGCVLQNRSLFSGISLLPGASAWSFSPGQPARKEPYFQRSAWENQAPLDQNGFYDHLKETFTGILPEYLRNGRLVGMSLTGGVDGRMIMAWAASEPGTLPCYTFGGTYRECADVRLAKKVARLCGQHHQVIPVNGEFLKDFPALARRSVYASDGAMDVTGSAELYVNRIARQIAPIRLTGNYGSEILRGNVAFGPDELSDDLFEPALERQVEAAGETYAEERRCHPLSFIAFKQVPWHHYSRFSLEQSELMPRSPFLDNKLVALMYRAPRASVLSKEPSFRLIAEGNPALSRIPTDRGLRVPPIPVVTRARNFYQEFTARAEYAYDYGMPQWLARLDRIASPLRLERFLLGRHKFCHFRLWYRKPLAGYVREVLLDEGARVRQYVRPGVLQRVVSHHTAGRANYTCEIHRLLALELIHRELLELQ